MGNFKAGDVVKLKSGGPIMTVVRYEPNEGEEVICQWFSENQLLEKAFHHETILRYKPPTFIKRTSKLLP